MPASRPDPTRLGPSPTATADTPIAPAADAGRPAPPQGRERLRLLVMLGALTAFGPLSFDMYLPGLPALAADLRITDAAAQLSLSLCMLGLGLGQVVTGPLSDQRGRRVPLLVGVAAFTVASLACAFAPNLPLLLVARFVGGFGGGAGAVIARSMVRDLFSGRDAAHAYAVTSLVFGIAPVVAPLVGALLVGPFGWRGIFVVIGAAGALLFVAALRVPETLPPARRHDAPLGRLFEAFPQVLRDRSFIAPALTLAIAFQPLSLYLAMSSFALQQGYGMSATGFGYLFAANSVGILAAGRLNVRLVDRVGPVRMLAASVVAGIVGSLGVAAATLAHAPLPVVVVALFVAVSSVGPLLPNATTLALERQGAVVGAAAACIGLLQTGLNAVVPPVVSMAGATPVVLGVSMAVASLVALAPLRAVRRDA